MKLRSMLARTAIAALMLSAAPQIFPGLNVTAPAEAAVNVSFSMFYDELGDYGDWVNYRGDYVFIPAEVGGNWRPYTRGHWAYTNRYGWTWVSNEPFGWATYHYGRWGYSDDIGWYWVPGKRWAPAWVSWRRSNDYVVWAPLPPTRRSGGDFSINVSVGDVPDYYWVAVPSRRFLEPDIGRAVLRDDRNGRDAVRRTKFLGTPRVENNIIINNVIDVNVISRETGRKVRPVEVRTTNDPGEARSRRGQVTAFQGEITGDESIKPRKLSDVGKVRKIKRGDRGSDMTDQQPNMPGATEPPKDSAAQGNQPGDAPNKNRRRQTVTDQNATDGNAPTAQQAETPRRDRKNRNVENGAVSPDAPPTDQAEAPTNNRKKRNRNDNAGAGDQPMTGQAEAPTGKRKKRNDMGSAPAMDDGTGTGQAQEQTRKSRRNQPQMMEEQNTGSTTPARRKRNQDQGQARDQGQGQDQQPAGRSRGKKGNQPCDPTTGADCGAEQ